MPRFVKQLTFSECIACIREILLDVSPVPSFTITGQGLSFSKTATEVSFGGNTYPITQFPKLYQLVSAIQAETGYGVTVTVDYYDLADTSMLVNCNHADLTADGKSISRSNYFPQDLIERYMEDFCRVYYFSVEDRYINDIVNNDFDYLYSKKICYWVAYWLIDVRRSSIALYNSVYAKSSSGYSSESPSTIGLDVLEDVTVRVGDVFTITQRQQQPQSSGGSMSGFNTVWGDRDSYWSRLQVYLRTQYEKLFGDFSLRDDVLRSSNFIIDKNWSPFAYVDTFDFSESTRNIFG